MSALKKGNCAAVLLNKSFFWFQLLAFPGDSIPPNDIMGPTDTGGYFIVKLVLRLDHKLVLRFNHKFAILSLKHPSNGSS